MSRYEVHLYDTDSTWSCQKSWSEQQHCASWLTLHRPAAGPTAGAGVGRVVSFYAFPQWWGISRSAPQLAIKKPALLIRPARCTATLSMKHCPAHLPNRTCSEKEEKKVPGKNHKKDKKKNGCTLAVWSVYTWSEAQSEAEKGEIGKKGEKTMNLIVSTLHIQVLPCSQWDNNDCIAYQETAFPLSPSTFKLTLRTFQGGGFTQDDIRGPKTSITGQNLWIL